MNIDVSAFQQKPDLFESFKETVRRVRMLTKDSTKRKAMFIVAALSIIGLLLAFDTLFLAAIFEEDSLSLLSILVLLIINTVAAYLIFSGLYAYGARSLTMRRFAEQNGFEFKPFINLQHASGTLFRLGLMEKYSRNGIAGNFRGTNFMLFDYRFAVGAYRYRNVRLFTVMVLNTGISYPTTRIENKRGYLQKVKKLTRSERIEQLDELPDGFTVYAEKQSAPKLSSVVNSNVMNSLSQAFPNFDMELIEKDVYIYSEGELSKPDAVASLFEAISAIRK